MIHLEPGRDGQPVGQLTTGTGHVVAFTGWPHLIRLLEDQLAQTPPPPGAAARPAGALQHPSRCGSGLACEVHAAQLHKGTRIPYLAHLMSVAALVLEHGGGEDAAIGGLLHDTVEDSDDGTQMERRIREEFGDHVAGIVMGCSDAAVVPGQPKPPWRDREAAYIGRLAGEDDPDVLLVSACDKLHNARAIVADLRAVGLALRDRFTEADPAAQSWCYQCLASCYQGRVPSTLSDELTRTNRQMQPLAS